MRTTLEKHGYGLDLFYSDDEASLQRALRARGIRGIILAPLIHRPHRHLPWDWSRLSVVIMGSGLWRPDFHRVRFHHFAEMALILHHLYPHIHQNYARLGAAADQLLGQLSLHQMGPPPDPIHINIHITGEWKDANPIRR